MITEAGIKTVVALMATATGASVVAATEAAGESGQLTLASAAVICVVTLFAALRWSINLLLKSKNDHIDALRTREATQTERADKAEKRERELLEELARYRTLQPDSHQPDTRESRRGYHGT